MGHETWAPPVGGISGSRTLLALVAGGALCITLAAYSGANPLTDDHRRVFLCATARAWQEKHPGEHLQVIVTEVTFQPSPSNFATGEGAVIAPVAVDLPALQEVLEVRGYPALLRILHVEGNTAVAWAYPGKLHRKLTYEAVALVRLAPQGHDVSLPDSPTFATLPDPWRLDACEKSEDLEGEEHQLERCKDFMPTMTALAGAPPYTDQLLRIVRGLHASPKPAQERQREDLCAALRSDALDAHEVQVAATLALRGLGAPAFGFAGADARHLYLVGTWVDGLGWITVNVARPSGFETGAGPIVAMAPLVSTFGGAVEGFWQAAGAAYAPGFAGASTLSGTRWVTSPVADEDVTVPRSMPLEEVCR